MIKVTELMIDEDGQVWIGEFEFESLAKLQDYKFYGFLVNQGSVVESPKYLDNFGNPMPKEYVEAFERHIRGREGVIIEWSVEYDGSWWFVEIDDLGEEERALMLTSPEPLIRQIVAAS